MNRIRRIAGLLAVAAGILTLPMGSSTAQEYDLDFTLPTAGKSGCMVCHGDPNLIRPVAGGFVSYWVDGAVLDASAHAGVGCVGCHTDFAFKAPHAAEATDWRRTARLSCKNCHQDQFEAYGRGVHSISVKPGELSDRERKNGASVPTAGVSATGSAPATRSAPTTASLPATGSLTATVASDAEKPLCGDCHGAHDIDVLEDNPDGRLRLHRRGLEVCGRCHEEEWASYNDYYHGRPYKRGTWDAPSCWQCHGWHDIYPSTDRRSSASEARLVETCGACHRQASEEFVFSTVGMIHGRDTVLEENPVYSAISTVGSSIAGLFDRIRQLFQ